MSAEGNGNGRWLPRVLIGALIAVAFGGIVGGFGWWLQNTTNVLHAQTQTLATLVERSGANATAIQDLRTDLRNRTLDRYTKTDSERDQDKIYKEMESLEDRLRGLEINRGSVPRGSPP